jgi:hypothetical protein
MSRASQSAVHSIIFASGTAGRPNSFTMRLESFSQPVGASLPMSLGGLPKSLPNSPASQRISTVSGPVTLIGVVGVVAWARQRSATALASPCQITLT